MATAEPDLTIAEAREAFLAVARDFGPKCDISVSLSNEEAVTKGLLRAFVRPAGYTIDTYFFVGADTFRELLDRVKARLDEHIDLHAENTIRAMALKIIEITADQGECTDAALRAEFDGADVIHYGERACERATGMASNGPFSIVTLSGANDREAA